MLTVGLDIGGANLKAATSDGDAVSRKFPLWKEPERLSEELTTLLDELPPADALAITMTGELVDGYPSKKEGVAAIAAAAVKTANGRPCHFWQTGGEFLNAEQATEFTRLVAAANWHALATFCGRVAPQGEALLIDVGSTTTDIIPLVNGRPTAEGMTDPERLLAGELVYSGATRTPLCALGPSLNVANQTWPIAAEFFATTRDVYLILGNEPQAPDDRDTADNRPATIACARSRLARMLCADPDELTNLNDFAQALANRQRNLIETAIQTVRGRLSNCQTILISGSGAHIAHAVIAKIPELASTKTLDLAEMFSRNIAGSACAFAVARLATERLNQPHEPNSQAPY